MSPAVRKRLEIVGPGISMTDSSVADGYIVTNNVAALVAGR